MSDSPKSGPAISPWWVLLLLPVVLGAGWLIGSQPESPGVVEETAVRVARDPLENPAVARGPASPAFRRDVAAPSQPAAEPEPPLTISEWTSLEKAVAESKRTGKPVFIDFNAAWCGPCRLMKEQVFDHPELGRQVQQMVIPVSIVDRVREDGRNPPEIQDLYGQFEVDAFPTLVVVMPNTGRAVRTKGFRGADRTVAWIRESVKAVR